MFERIVKGNLQARMAAPETLIIYGPRRVGKTTLLNMVHDDLCQKNAPVAFYTLDDPGAQAIFAEPSIDRLERIFSELGFSPKRRNYLLLDEIQGFQKVNLLLKLIFDHFAFVKVVATSSSSLLLLQSLTDSLAGRKYFIELLPLTLEEVTGIHAGNYFSFPESITQQGALTEFLRTMAVYGTYPEVLNNPVIKDKQAKLRDILESALYKDILMLERLKSPQVLTRLLTLLAYQIGNLVDLNELATQLGISRNTVDQYIAILEKYFLVFRLPAFNRNLRSELSTKFKLYFWDTGIRNALINRFYPFEARDDKGAVFENLVIASIMKRNLYAGRPFNACFWRTYQGYEIDLVLENNQTCDLMAFQISLAGKISFSRAFSMNHPSKTFVVRAENAYRFCW